MWDQAGQGERQAARLRRAIEDMLIGLGVPRGHSEFDDCVQEGLLAVLCLAPDARCRGAYDLQAAKWAAIAHLQNERRHRVRPTIPRVEFRIEDIVLEDLMQTEQFVCIAQVLSRREVLIYILAVHSPLTQRQIGALAGLSPRSVRRRLRSARRKVAAMEAALAACQESASQPACAPASPARNTAEGVAGHVL